jgi:hypothetical protein
MSFGTIELPRSSPRPVYPTRKLLQPSPTHPDDYVLEIDYSSLSKFLECPRAYENYAILSREADRDHSATDFGKLFHECEELRLAHGFCDAVTQRQRELVAQHFLQHPCSPTDHRTAERMLSVLALYQQRYLHDGWDKKIVQHEGAPFIERPFKIELCTIPVNAHIDYTTDEVVVNAPIYRELPFIRNIHVIFTGRIDAALHDSNLIFVMDNKTSSRGGREFEEAFNLSLQTRGYTWALQKILGTPVAGLIMNALVIKPPTLKLQNNTELTRHTYFYSQESLDEWEQNVRAHVSDLVHNLVRGYWPQSGLSFKSPCAMCDYSQNCVLPPAQRAADLASALFRDVTWNPIH